MSEIATKSQTQIQLSQESMTSLGDLTTLMKFANELCKSEALPPNYKNAANVLVALQTGKEMGLQPMQSLRMLYTVNGNIKPWGTAYPYFLRKAGYQINIKKHDKTVCEIQVTKGDETYEYIATKDDISASSKAYGFAPKEKLFFHACARIINYYLPEIMMGMNFDNDSEDFSNNQNSEIVMPEQANNVTTEAPQKTDLHLKIEEAHTLEDLNELQELLSSKEERSAFNTRIKEIKNNLQQTESIPETTADGALLAEVVAPHNVSR